ncbi:MAG: TonB-dependent receptor plug domain-containing protein, partial [Gammaproteobacteria bacterium]|nr:TonB-dependent receptor plug domain-containing protein [Gammaproteobacteria bacterium]
MTSSDWRRCFARGTVVAVFGGLVPISAAQTVETSSERGVEEVIVTAPGGSSGVDISRYPGNAQVATDQELIESGAINLNEFLSRGLGSVHINDAQNNPYQPELFYRGFGSSSLLGFPQGIAIYTDGVRRNELFGDVVNWDTLPDSAIASIQLIPGSNPLFGLNTLGGAVAMETKDGFSHAGTGFDVSGGSFNRFNGQVETGGNTGNFGWFFTLEGFTEDGWRDFSDSDLVQLFGKASWRGERYETDLSLTLADTDLRGNGATPEELIDIEGREAVFTFPDQTENEMLQIHARTNWYVDETITVTSGLYYRKTDTDTFNGDGSDFDECEEPARAVLVCEQEGDEEELALDQFGNPIPFSDAVDGGTENSSETRQDAIGGSLQMVFDRVFRGKDHQILVGGSVDYGNIEFEQRTELAALTDERGTIGSGFIVGDSITDVDTEITHGSVFFSDTFALTDRADLTMSARFNHTDVELDDTLVADTEDDDESASLT